MKDNLIAIFNRIYVNKGKCYLVEFNEPLELYIKEDKIISNKYNISINIKYSKSKFKFYNKVCKEVYMLYKQGKLNNCIVYTKKECKRRFESE